MHEHGHDDDVGTQVEALPDGGLEAGAGAGRILFIDAFSGIAGDMLVAALLDLGVPRAVVDEAVAALGIDGFTVEVTAKVRSGIRARHFAVHVLEPQPARDYAQIRALLQAAVLPVGAREIAERAFRLLAEAEAAVHGVAVQDVHFHEVGAVDSIVDIVAAAAALDHLGARVIGSPLPMGRGTVDARHGVLPLPAPATVSCLRGVPTFDAGIDAELVTPTGACLVAATASGFARWPDLTPERCGWGAGTRELPDRPNLLRLVLGTGAGEAIATEAQSVAPDLQSAAPFAVLEANVDDMTAEIAAHAVTRALDAGALDAWTTAIGMKKGRPALMISALVRRPDIDGVGRCLLAETTSLGLRIRPCYRIERPRRTVDVVTAYGPIAVKVSDGDGLPTNAAPEFEACRAAAEEHGVALKEVYAAALAALGGR